MSEAWFVVFFDVSTGFPRYLRHGIFSEPRPTTIAGFPWREFTMTGPSLRAATYQAARDELARVLSGDPAYSWAFLRPRMRKPKR